MEIAELVKLATGTSVGIVIAIMVLKFMFRIVEKKFDVDSELIQKNYMKNIEIANSVDNVSKTVEKVSDSQIKITESQNKIVHLIDSVDKRINSYKMGS